MENFMRKLVAVGFVIIISALQVNSDCPRRRTLGNVIVIYPPNVPRTGQLPENTMISFKCKPGYQYVQGDKTVRCLHGRWVANGKTANTFICEIKDCPAVNIENGTTEVINGIQIKYSCNRGFKLKGFANSQCRLNKQGNYYVVHTPTCEALAECENPKDSGVEYEGKCCYADDRIKLSCSTGYRLEGTAEIICLSTGNWSSYFPICKWIQKCEDPGNSSFSIRNGSCCEIGDILTYTCEEGYELVDPEAGNWMTCLPEERWSGPKPRCKPKGAVVCPDIPLKKNNLRFEDIITEKKDVYVAWDELYLQCKDGYTTNDTLSLFCQEDGQWDEKVPICIPENPCLRPPIPDNGQIDELIDNDQLYLPIGFEINILCKENHEIKSGHYGSRCLGDNKWENGITNCTLIECSDPGIPDGAQRYGDDFHLGSSVTYKCIGNLNLLGSEVRTCEQTRRWSGQTTVCDAGDTHCPDPGIPLHSSRKIEGFNHGDKIIYSCEPESQMIGNSTRICLEDGTWSEEEVICLGSNEYPDMEVVAKALSKTMVQISRQSAYSKPVFGRSTISSDHATGVTIFFLLDASGSITKTEFKKSKELAIHVVRQIGISTHKGGVRISVINFSQNVETVVTWAVESVEQAITRIDSIEKRKDEGTNIAKALNHLANEVASTKENDLVRDNKNIAFIISDGNANEGGKPEKEAKLLKKFGVKMFAIAVGKKRDRVILKIITNDENNIFEFDSYQKLFDVISRTIGNQTNFQLCGINQPNLIKRNKINLNKNRRKRFIDGIGRIVGGQEAEYSWPWMAALYLKNKNNKWEFKCGGSIIHSDWILTAAHCFFVVDGFLDIDEEKSEEIQSAKWKASVGRLNISDENSGLFYKISTIKIHQEYDSKSYGNDIALLKVDKSIVFDIYTSPICLPPSMNDIPEKSEMYSSKSEAYVVGWGNTEVADLSSSQKQKNSDILLQLKLPLHDDKICKQKVNFKASQAGKEITHYLTPSPNSLCAGTGEGKQDACQGDSGGPLMQLIHSNSSSNIMKRWFEIGIVSWGIGCGLEGYYGYYTHVSKLKQWILNETNSEFEIVALNV
uniref:C3/C5 convertase n=1 Tax=Scolopendra japonica TaxID=2609777 RepID=A0A0E4FJJ9_9MYRI|nr:complement factor B-1 [Scolopendra japonica]